MKRIILLSSLLFAITLSASLIMAQDNQPTLFEACPEAQAWWDEATPHLVDFMDLAQIAGVTSRISLSPVLIEMRNAQRSFERINVPDCATQTAEKFSVVLDNAVLAYLLFAAQEDELATSVLASTNGLMFSAVNEIGALLVYTVDEQIFNPLWFGAA